MKRYFILLFFVLTFSFGCKSEENPENKEFSAFTNQLFIEAASSDALTLNYMLENPDDFGILKSKSPLGTYSYEEMKKSIMKMENRLHSLQAFDDKKLSFSQQVLFDTLSRSFSHALKERNFLLHQQILAPVSGFQAQLPVILSEFHFTDKKDIESYFSILDSMPKYFEDIIRFEQTRAKNNTYMNSSTVSNIVYQCRDFIQDPQNNVIISTFNEKIKDITFLSNKEKRGYKKKNTELVLDSVIRAYQSLILGLESLRDKARNDGGLSTLKDGRDYYRYLVESEVGTLRSIEDIWTMLDNALNSANSTLHQLALKDPTLFSQNYRSGIHANSPSEILKTLETSIFSDFPEIKKVNYEVKYVPESLEKFLSPAFYLTPPLDQSNANVIYVNNSARYKSTDLFPTLAHEGYPGHLYQSVFLNTHQTSPLQGALNFGGYTEGWATHAELYSYRYAGIKEDISTILQNNTISSLSLTSLCDIGIHYKGWKLKDTIQFLGKYGFQDVEACSEIYQSLLDEPASYLKYSVGYLELMELKKKAKELLGNKYTDKEFHKYILSMGPTWFDVLDDYMEEWFQKL